MNGINIDNLDSIINKNNSYLNSFNLEKAKLVNVLKDINSCFDGKSVEFIYSKLSENNNLNVISKIIENYSTVLLNVKTSYQKQDQSILNKINHIDSNN